MATLADDADKTAAKSHRHDYIPGFERHDAEKRTVRQEEKSQKKFWRRARTQENAAATADEDSPSDGVDDGDNRDDGTSHYFGRQSFQDTDFSRRSFIDLMINSPPKPGDSGEHDADKSRDDTKAEAKDDSKDDHDRKDDDKNRDGLTIHQDLRRAHDRRLVDEILELLAAPETGPNHWVPDKLDPLDNGGFTTAPDNGSPVPYRLNGHVDLERDLPWEKSD